MNLDPGFLREQYRNGLLKPSQVMQNVLSRLDDEDQSGVWISTLEPQLAMYSALSLDARIAEIDQLPLYGLIFSVKDCIDVKGQATTSACPEFSYLPAQSSPVVDSAISAGALYLGKTNLDQFCTGLVGVRSPYGVARNPHNPLYIPGGSSSGAAVSVATGTSSFALGTDTGGSGRVPASYCGVTGLKPAPGCLSRRGMVAACRTIDTISIYARQPRDAYSVLQVLGAYDKADPFSTPNYRHDSYPLTSTDITKIRVAVPVEEDLNFFGNQETSSIFEQAIRLADQTFGSLLRVSYTLFADINQLMFAGPLVAERDVAVGDFFDAHPTAGVDAVRQLILKSRSMTAADAYKAHYRIIEARRQMQDFWLEHDVLLLPTVGTIYTVEQAMQDPFMPSFNNGYYTNFANPLGLSAISVPFGRTLSSVPYGVTFVAPAGGENFLSRLGQHFIETAQDKCVLNQHTG
jgi:allophanate hydrolase